MKIDQAIRYLEIYKKQYGNLDIFMDEVIIKPNDPNFRKVVRHDCSIVVTTNESKEYIVSIHKKKPSHSFEEELIEILKEKQIRKLHMGAGLAAEHCDRPDLLDGFAQGLSAAETILRQRDEDKIVGAAAFCRKMISHLAGAKREHWTDERSSKFLSLPDENWIVK